MNPGYHRIGKDLSAVSWFHGDFVGQEESLRRVQEIAEENYAKGPHRDVCVLCATRLSGDIFFERGKLAYIFCANCGHLNGNRLLSKDFAELTYKGAESDKEEVESVYSAEFTSGKMALEYREVVERIYGPKSDFLRDFFLSENLPIENLEILDFGCGSGHFINALMDSGFSRVSGVDTYGPAIGAAVSIGGLDPSNIREVDLDETVAILRRTQADVVCMMCVLVHLESIGDAVAAMRENKSIRYSFQKIPMWSFATILEAALPEFRARVLGSDHTNVFTRESLAWLENRFGLSRVASWTFGSDVLDLQRKVLASLAGGQASEGFVKRVQSDMEVLANPVQYVIDSNLLSSEIHVIWKFPARGQAK
jgi:SAM-dependent methyltransferase